MPRGAILVIVSVTVAVFAAFAPSAAASHAGATVTCEGIADPFTIKAATNAADFQSPAPDKMILFEEGGVLTVHRLFVNGQLAFTRAPTGLEQNAITEVTCSFTIGAGATFTVTGILAGT
jgi:hypothetical protein